MKNYLLLLLLCLIGRYAQAQEHEAPAAEDSSLVTIHADPKLAVVVKKNENIAAPIKRSYKTKGYRIQIYSGNDRNKASQAKVKFMKLFPGIRSYLVYNAPNFRVRVGDFRSRRETQELYQKLALHFRPCMIVPDLVTVSPKKNDNPDKD